MGVPLLPLYGKPARETNTSPPIRGVWDRVGVAEGLDLSRPPFDRGLGFGYPGVGLSVRWWSAASSGRADKQGMPVQIRNGPAAVTEDNEGCSVFYLAIVAHEHFAGRREGRAAPSSEVRRPTSAGQVAFCEGQEPQRRLEADPPE